MDPIVVDKIFSREDQYQVSCFVEYRHAVGKGSLQACPSRIDSQIRIDIGARGVKGLMDHATDHIFQMSYVPLVGLPTYYPSNPWHSVFSYLFNARGNSTRMIRIIPD